MKVSDFNFELPKELIAQHPIEKRDESRLMVLNKDKIEHRVFKDIIEYLNPGDCLVLNNTKVIPARLYGNKITNGENGAAAEVLLLKQLEDDIWEVLVRPGRKLQIGTEISFKDNLLKGTIIESLEDGKKKNKI